MSQLFIHSVYFWLIDGYTDDDRAHVENGIRTLLKSPGAEFAQIGTPADTDRPVIDHSYDFHLLLGFKTRADHDAYQETDAVHQAFIKNCSPYWKKVLVYDSVGI